MAFNAYWEFESLAKEFNISDLKLMKYFQKDMRILTSTSKVYKLNVTDSGTYLTIENADGSKYEPRPETGLYSILCKDRLLYFGEATDLKRRHLKDADNTADSTKGFINQGRAILKLIAHRKWQKDLGIYPYFIQLYPSSAKIWNQLFEDKYKVSKSSKVLEGAGSLFIDTFHKEMLGQLKIQDF